MADPGLKIVVGADISAVTDGMKAAANDVSKFSQSASKSFNQVEAAVKKVPEAAKNILPEGSIAEARATVKRLKDEIASLSSAQLNSSSGKFLVSELGAAKSELKSLEQQSNLTSQAVGGNLTKGFGLLRQAAILIPGIGISGIIGLIGTAAIEIAQDLLKLSDSAKLAGHDIEVSFADAVGKVAGEQSTLHALVDIARDETLSKQARTEAINKLNQEYDKYLPKLTLENINTAAVTAEVNKLSDALLRQAKIKGLQDLISKETAKQADLLTNSLEDNANSWDKLTAIIKGAGAGAVGVNMQLQIAGAERTGIAFKESSEKIKIFNDTLKQLLTTEATEGTLDKGGKRKKDIDELGKQLSLLEKIRDAAKEFQGKLFDLKDIDAATDKLAALEQQVGDLKLKIGIRDAKKAGLPAAEIAKLSDAIKLDTQKRLNEAFEKEALELEFNPKLKPSRVDRLDVSDLAAHSFTFKQQLKVVIDGENLKFEVKDIPVDVTDLQDRIAKAVGLDKKIPAITLHEARILIDGKKVTAQIEGKEHIIDELNKQVAGIFEGGLNDALSGIGEAFGEALASSDFGSGLKKAAESILGVVGNVMQQLGKAVIAAAIKIKLLKETLEKWAIANPGLAIIAGIGLVAAGVALKSLKFDGPKFADGGIATGPVIGQVGERFRPEVILPLDRLPQLFKQIGGDAGGGTQLIPIINNEGLYLAMKRGERSAGRKF